MQASDIPTRFQLAFAANAGPGYIRTVPFSASPTPGAASFDTGFPPDNFQPQGAGGTPPFGQDFNGLMKAVTQWIQWGNAGGAIPFDATFATAIGGYPKGAVIPAAVGYGVYWISTADNNTNNPDTGGANWLQWVPLGPLITPNTGTNYTYAQADQSKTLARSNAAQPMVDTLPGTGTGVLPATWQTTIYNADTAALLCIKPGIGATLDGSFANRIYLGTGQSATIGSDGSNYYSIQKPALCTMSANATLYVSPTGLDSNDGLSPGSPLQTVQAAFNLLLKFNLNNLSMTIQLADGTYTGGLVITGAIQGNAAGGVTINGNAAMPSNVVISSTNASAIQASNGENLTVNNLKLTTTGSGDCIISDHNSNVIISNLVFGPCAGSHMHAISNGVINLFGSYTITGGASNDHMQAGRGGQLLLQSNITVTLSGTPAFGQFAHTQECGVILATANINYTGSATGKRYLANTNGVINTNGGGANFYPGNVAGSTNNGGVYT